MSMSTSLREALSRELSLDEMLADPIVRIVMKRDGVREGDIRALAVRAAEGRR